MKVIKKNVRAIVGVLLLVATIVFADSWVAASGVGMALVINTASLQALFQGFKNIFQQAFNAAMPQYTKIAINVPSNAEQEVYVWLGAWPKMREWLGERVVSNLKASDWTIKNKDWESTVGVPRNKIKFDTYGVFRPMFEAMGSSARMHPDHIVFPLLTNGFTNKGYDGKTFFATDHAFGSNKDTHVLSLTTFGNALAKLKRMKDTNDNPLFDGSEKIYLVVPPELEATAAEICNATFVVGADGKQKENVMKGKATPITSSLLTSATAWFLVVDFNGLKPLVFQNAQPPDFVAKEDPQTSDHVFMKKEYLYGVDTIDNAGYGLPQLAFGSTGVDA